MRKNKEEREMIMRRDKEERWKERVKRKDEEKGLKGRMRRKEEEWRGKRKYEVERGRMKRKEEGWRGKRKERGNMKWNEEWGIWRWNHISPLEFSRTMKCGRN